MRQARAAGAAAIRRSRRTSPAHPRRWRGSDVTRTAMRPDTRLAPRLATAVGADAHRSSANDAYARLGAGSCTHSCTSPAVVRSWRAGSVAYQALKYSSPAWCASSVKACSASVTHTRSKPF